MPTWTSNPLPVRPGLFINFLAAATAAVSSGVGGTSAELGTADWGPVGQAVPVSSQGQADTVYWANSAGTLHQGILDGLGGLDSGGANTILAYRVAASSAAAGAVTLADGSAVAALTLTGKYVGARPNVWTVNVQTNALNSGNKDVYLLESGQILSSYLNVAGGTNTAIAAAFANDPYVNAAVVGAANRALANITGVIAGAGGFTGGNSGLTPTLGDWTAALNSIAQIPFDAVTIVGVFDTPTQTLFNSWLANLNSAMWRAFGIIGGGASEGITAAIARSQSFNNRDLVNIGATDLVNVSTGQTRAPYQMVAAVAGAIAGTQLSRSMTNTNYTGFQVTDPLDNGDYTNADIFGVLTFRNNTPSQVAIEAGVTTFSAPGPTDPPSAHLQIANVAIDHFVSNSLTLEIRQTDMGQIANDTTGQNTVINQVLTFLKALDKLQRLQAGRSTVALSTRIISAGTAMFLDLYYFYQGFAERFFLTARVG
jgi:hypothetical protein